MAQLLALMRVHSRTKTLMAKHAQAKSMFCITSQEFNHKRSCWLSRRLDEFVIVENTIGTLIAHLPLFRPFTTSRTSIVSYSVLFSISDDLGVNWIYGTSFIVNSASFPLSFNYLAQTHIWINIRHQLINSFAFDNNGLNQSLFFQILKLDLSLHFLEAF